MRHTVFPDYQALCTAVAEQVVLQLHRKPESVLVFPTGNTPLGLFAKLVERATAGGVDFSRAHVVILDEYADLEDNDPRSFTGWLKRALLSRVNFTAAHIHDFTAGADAMERKILSLGGLDLVILGLGLNGHLGFNEPGSPFDSRTRRVTLTPASIASNAAYWGSEDRVPRQGTTLGLGTVSDARKLILMVSGVAKRDILKQTLSGAISPDNPASLLRTLAHAEIFSDAAAATGEVQNACR